MKTSQAGIDLIKFFEGEKLNAYMCPAGVPTIGVGSTFYEDGKKVKIGDKITKERSIQLLINTLKPFEKQVDTKIKIDINQQQFDALVSHTFNTGGSETLFKLVNAKSSKEAIKHWFESRYITGGGKVLDGLIARRKAEAKLYFS